MAIIILEESVANKIAAGEVVERPASVVKELVENSIDAGARRIEIEIEEGGRGLIRVTDDGYGMSPEDAVLALQRHATSKIHSVEDLFSVNTLGFRGEALPSIAAVSRLLLVARPADQDAGAKVIVEGGKITDMQEVGAPTGTQVTVSHLFYNTPARLKFLRSDAAELTHITEVITRFALSHSHLALRLTHNGREVVSHPGGGDLEISVAAVFGRDNLVHLVRLDSATPVVKVRGYVSTPTFTRASRSYQYVFINGRGIRSRSLTHALESVYSHMLPPGRYPVAVLLLEIDAHRVDVNVHPTKAEVRFLRESEVYAAVHHAVQEVLEKAGVAKQVESAPATSGSELLPAAPPLALVAPSTNRPMIAATHPALQPGTHEGLILTPLAQLRATYILAESSQGLLVVDQHRAHERVLYDRFLHGLEDGKPIESQPLAVPATVNLAPHEAGLVQDHLEHLLALGFLLEQFGANTFLVRAVPAPLAKADPVTLLRDMAEDISSLRPPSGPSSGALEESRERTLITTSCKSAVKAGDLLQFEEMAELLQALAATSRPYTCPHGAPTVMTISHFELDRKFRR